MDRYQDKCVSLLFNAYPIYYKYLKVNPYPREGNCFEAGKKGVACKHHPYNSCIYGILMQCM